MMLRPALLIFGALFFVSMAAIPPNYQEIPGHGIYRVSTVRKTWEEAQLDCEDDLAGLAIINSPEESVALKKLLVGTAGSGLRAHIGFEDRDGDGQFTTVLNAPLAKSGFNTWKNNPSNTGEAMCGTMWICGRLGETNCGDKLSYICEIQNEPNAV